MKLLNESFLCAAVRFLSAILCRLPYGLNLAIARGMGLIAYCVMSRKKAIIESNLRTAFSANLSQLQIRALTKQVFKNLLSSFVELLCFPKIHSQGFQKIVTVEGQENVDQAIAKGQGCILLAIHSGNWELANLVGGTFGHPYSVVANEHEKTPKLNELLNGYRRLVGAKIIPAGIATREIIRVLQANEIVTLVLDQGGKDGVAVDFFGKTASMSTGAIRLGLKYGTPVCPAWIERQAGGKHILRILPALILQTSGDHERDVLVNTQKAVKTFEDFLRAHPSEFMWFYKIYKYTTQADVLILDDGKTGHLRQSQALAEILRTALVQESKQARIKTVTIIFKSFWHQKMFVVYCFCAQAISFLRTKESLGYFLKEDCYRILVGSNTDYILSCGSQSAPVSFILSRLSSLKSVHILRPGILSWRWFSLIVLPEHDKVLHNGSRPPMVTTKVALNLITPEYLKAQQEKLFLHYSHLRNNVRSKIGVLLGGNTKGVVFDVNQIRLLVRQLKDAAEHYNMDLLVTTSRRTPPEVDQMIIKELRNLSRCPLLIIPNETNIPEAVGGILASSDILIVSGESISMVSEALSSGKKTIVFAPAGSYRIKSLNKYDRFVLELNQQGYLLASSIKDISNVFTQSMSQKISVKSINDRINISKALEGIL